MLFLQALVLLPLLWPGSRAQEYGAGVVPTRVKIDSGLIIGAPTTVPGANTAVNRYLGVPFAKSPPARFEPPEQVAAWSQPLETKQFKPSCIQALATGSEWRSLVILSSPSMLLMLNDDSYTRGVLQPSTSSRERGLSVSECFRSDQPAASRRSGRALLDPRWRLRMGYRVEPSL